MYHILTFYVQLFYFNWSSISLCVVCREGYYFCRQAKDICFACKPYHSSNCAKLTGSSQIETERLTVSSKTVPSTSTSPPKYALELVYHHSANGGKALLKRGKEAAQQG